MDPSSRIFTVLRCYFVTLLPRDVKCLDSDVSVLLF